MTADPIRVLFVCTHNSARSQIAEALLKRDGGSLVEARSAGTEVTRVHPLTIAVLGEVGIDWSGARSKSVQEFLGQSFDYVVTVCDDAREACPVFPGARNTQHWSLEDPSAVGGSLDEQMAAFRRTRSEVTARLAPLLDAIGSA